MCCTKCFVYVSSMFLSNASTFLFFFFFLITRRPPNSPLFPYPPLSRSRRPAAPAAQEEGGDRDKRDLAADHAGDDRPLQREEGEQADQEGGEAPRQRHGGERLARREQIGRAHV